VFNVLFVGYSLAKNNLNNTYQYNISKNFSKTMNYLIILNSKGVVFCAGQCITRVAGNFDRS
jgi:hypothetical protein